MAIIVIFRKGYVLEFKVVEVYDLTDLKDLLADPIRRRQMALSEDVVTMLPAADDVTCQRITHAMH